MNILIPTDFSDTARNALKYAVTAFGEGSRFILINAYEEPRSTSASMISLRDILYESSVDSLEEELAFVKLEMGLTDLNIETHAIYGDAASCITHFMKGNEVDVVVMGTTGATGLKEVTMGSVAAGVIQKVSVPVIAVPATLDTGKPHRVLFATDLRELDHPELPLFFLEMLQENACEVTILTINKDSQPLDQTKLLQAQLLEKQLENVKIDFVAVQADDVDEAIIQYATTRDMDLVVTTPHKGTWFQRLLKRSVSKQLVHHLQVPMLALNQV